MKQLNVGDPAKRTDVWLTPPAIIKALGEFDLDPCSPVNRPWDTAKIHLTEHDDGLLSPWESTTILSIFEACQETSGNKIYTTVDCADAVSARMINHVLLIISHLKENISIQSVSNVSDFMQKPKCPDGETIHWKALKSKLQKINIENLLKAESVSDSVVLSVITDIEGLFSDGHNRIGNIVNPILETSVRIVNSKRFYIRIISLLYQMILAPEQFLLTSFQLVENVTAPSVIKVLLNGQHPKLLQEYSDILNTSIRVSYKQRVFMNPPYSALEAWMNKIALHGNGIALTFCRTETKAFQNYVFPHATSLFFFKGRLSFYDSTGKIAESNAGTASVLIAYNEFNSEAIENSNLLGVHVPINSPDVFVISYTSDQHTWKVIVRNAVEELGGTATTTDIYETVVRLAPKRVQKNRHYKEKIRQMLQMYFTRQEQGKYSISVLK